jgi:hypothetical protein
VFPVRDARGGGVRPNPVFWSVVAAGAVVALAAVVAAAELHGRRSIVRQGRNV